MTRLMLVLVLTAMCFGVEAPTYMNAGALRCGWVQRPNAQVQVWCFEGIVFNSDTMRCNKVAQLPPSGSVVESCNWPVTGDSVTWEFWLQDGTLAWDVVVNAPTETAPAFLSGLNQNLLPIEGPNGPELITVEWANVTFLRGPGTSQPLIHGGN